jgi:BirA family biotin operon repressor/biotin-[acetyl-CoA-carboxylase] ligase
LSLAWRTRRAVRELAGLSLAAGVAAARALRALGARDVALKWPNDLFAHGAKLGGVLVETRALATGTLVVVGIGLNCRTHPGLGARLRRKVAALEELLDPLPPRSALAARIAAELLDVLEAFDASGLETLRGEWEAMNAYAGRRLRVRLGDGRTLAGLAAGIAADGALRLRTRAGVRELHSGRIVS